MAVNATRVASCRPLGKTWRDDGSISTREPHPCAEVKKFHRLIKFGEALPKLRSTVSRHLREPDLGRERCGLHGSNSFHLLSRPESGVRKRKWQLWNRYTPTKHVNVRKGVVQFDFPGKSGVRQRPEIKDRQVATIVKNLIQHPGREVFKYQNGDGAFINVTNRHINEYIKETMGERFSAKDFRTWAGTIICACALARVGTEAIEKKAGRKRKVVAAIKETAEMLGNTPAVCRSSYINPAVINGFEKGKTIDGHFETLEN